MLMKIPTPKKERLSASSEDCSKEYQNVFRKELLEGLPPRHSVGHAIETGDASPECVSTVCSTSAGTHASGGRVAAKRHDSGECISMGSSCWLLFALKKMGE